MSGLTSAQRRAICDDQRTESEIAEDFGLTVAEVHAIREPEEEESDGTCADCLGTGIGWNGPDSACSSCKGRGYDLPERDPDDDRDQRMENARLRAEEEGNYGGPL